MTDIETGGAENQAAAEKQESAETRRIAELEEKVREQEKKYLYLYAEFENFRKRALREHQDLKKFGWEPVARDLLHVLDNMERAITHTDPGKTDKNLIEGLHGITASFRKTLAHQGIQAIETDGKDFDPDLHEAVGQMPSEHGEGRILREETRGYTWHGRLLRPARVVVSSGGKPDGAGS